jgi:hypothetical protein
MRLGLRPIFIKARKATQTAPLMPEGTVTTLGRWAS